MQAINISSVLNYLYIGRTHKWLKWSVHFRSMSCRTCEIQWQSFVLFIFLDAIAFAVPIASIDHFDLFISINHECICVWVIWSDVEWRVIVTEQGETQWKSFPSLGNPWEIFQPGSNDVISQFWESISLWLFVDPGWKWWIMLGQDFQLSCYY